jgi:IMP dehydrogenase
MNREWKIDDDLKQKDAVTFDDVSMVPRYSEIESRGDVDLTSKLTANFTIPTPLIAAPMSTVTGLTMIWRLAEVDVAAPMHRFASLEEQVEVISKFYNTRRHPDNVREYARSKVPTIGSIGVGKDALTQAERLIEAGAEILIIDVAHGDHLNVKRMLTFLNSLTNRHTFDVIAGNIATADAAQRLQEWGADGLRVGIGGGSMCETRTRTGIGVPQLQAIMDIAKVALLPIIADGGIRSPGDVAKALAAGADTVMIGSLFSGTSEAPGQTIITGEWPNTQTFKVYQGSASLTQKMVTRGGHTNVEGTAKIVPAKGSVTDVVQTILDGVRSSMSYLGVDYVQQMREVAEFVRVTNAGLVEAHPHGLGN